MKKLIALAFVLPLIFSCGKEDKSNTNEDVIEYNDSTSVQGENKTQQTTNHIIIKANEDMTFDKTEFTVKVGDEITLLLVNNGTSSKEAMGHNVVVLNQGVDMSAFAFAASSEKDADYIPAEKQSDILAYTKLLGPKESDQIKFKIEKAGDYDFLCTFPGHAATMNGKIKAIN